MASEQAAPPTDGSAPSQPRQQQEQEQSTLSGSDVEQAHKTLYEIGLSHRTAVTGPAHVQRSLQNATPFGQPMQQYVTEACWGSIWARPGLDHKTRSLLNVVMLGALGKPNELGVHVRGALRNGASEVEIQEALLQMACYCGMPAGMSGFQVAEKVVGEFRAEQEQEKLGRGAGQ